MARGRTPSSKKKKAPHLRAVNPDEPAQKTSGEETPWKTIILVTVATTVAGQIVIDAYRALKKRALKGQVEENPQPQWEQRQLAPAQQVAAPRAIGPTGNPGGYAPQGPPMFAQASQQEQQYVPQQSPPTAWQQQPAGPPPQVNPQPQQVQHGYADLQAWEDRLRRWEKDLEDEQRQFRMMRGP